MTPEEFVQKPWAESCIHRAYKSSFLHMRPAPEYASGEVVLASTYRQVGFWGDTMSERNVPKYGREFQKNLARGKRPCREATDTGIDAEAWQRVITGTLRSPKQPNQAAKRFLQISPVVPDTALYSLSARLSSNSWNPGALVARMIQFGAPSPSSAQDSWNRLFHALSVDDDDDIWARFLHQEFQTWRNKTHADCVPAPRQLKTDEPATAWHRAGVPIPSNRFVRDLDHVLSLKVHLTRRQWISMVEAMLRVGTASHILWICKSNIQCFQLIRDVLKGEQVPTRPEFEQRFGVKDGFWRYGQLAAGTITDNATGFIKARAGLNLFLHHLEGHYDDLSGCLANLESIEALAHWLQGNLDKIDTKAFWHNYQDVLEYDQRLVAGKKGIASNVREFLRHVLGQRQTAEPGLDSYDQGYFLAKRGAYKSAPWVVSLGPVSVLALVHACTYKALGPRTVEDLCMHLAEYGLEVQAQEVPTSPLGQKLRNLGLVLDSPDAEGGMVVMNPFEHVAKETSTS